MITFKTKPFDHQREAFNKSKDLYDFGLLMSAGTGKTKVIIDNAAYLYDKGQIDTLLVGAPNGVHRNWIGEVEAHMPSEINYKADYYSNNSNIQRTKEFAETLAYKSGLRIITFNVETLSTKTGLDKILSYITRRKTMLVMDESQKIKSPSSKRTKNSYKIANITAYHRILSGTPVSQGLQDLYSQFKFLNPKIIACKTFAEFKSIYCVMGGWEGREIVDYKNVDQLLAKIDPYIFQADKRLLNLPPETWCQRETELSNEQWKLYKDLRDEFVAELKGDRLEVAQAGVRMMRLRQIISGLFWTPEGLVSIPCPRLETMADLVEEAARDKVIIWCHFQEDVKRVIYTLEGRDIKCVPYYGAITQDQRAINVARWKTESKITALVATPATGGTGYTFTEADTDITYSHNYSYEEWEQKSARNHRAGTIHPVTHYDLVARGTADVKMLARVRKKGSIADLVKNLNRKELIDLFF